MWLVRDRMQSEMWKRLRAESWGTVNFRVGGRAANLSKEPKEEEEKAGPCMTEPREEQGLEVTSSGSLELGCAHSFLQNVASSRLPVSSAFASFMKYFYFEQAQLPLPWHRIHIYAQPLHWATTVQLSITVTGKRLSTPDKREKAKGRSKGEKESQYLLGTNSVLSSCLSNTCKMVQMSITIPILKVPRG